MLLPLTLICSFISIPPRTALQCLKEQMAQDITQNCNDLYAPHLEVRNVSFDMQHQTRLALLHERG